MADKYSVLAAICVIATRVAIIATHATTFDSENGGKYRSYRRHLAARSENQHVTESA
jgi:hypothetical protein